VIIVDYCGTGTPRLIAVTINAIERPEQGGEALRRFQ
jgi:hypothetical protein